ncbi:MAG: S-layer homology domain-containing protein, partial [Clostridia bacterium]|nr:S-layer homology domain-containing protein [Clostridia bacterium]
MKKMRRVLSVLMGLVLLLSVLSVPVFAASQPVPFVDIQLSECYVGATAEDIEVSVSGNVKTDGGYNERYAIVDIHAVEAVFGDLALDGQYIFCYRLEAQPGYTLTEMTLDDVALNGRPADNLVSADGDLIAHFVLPGFGLEVIRSIELYHNNVKPVGGQSVYFPTINSIVGEYVLENNVAIVDTMEWYENDTFSTVEDDYQDYISTTFTAGKAHDLYTEMEAMDGYVFSRDLEVKLRTGSTRVYTGHVDFDAMNNISVNFYFDYFETPTDNEVTLGGYEVGYDVENIGVSIDSYGLVCGETYYDDFVILGDEGVLEEGTFAANTRYRLGICVSAEEAFSIANLKTTDFELYGKPATSVDISGSYTFVYFDLPQLKTVKTKITSIDIILNENISINKQLIYPELLHINGNASDLDVIYNFENNWFYADELEDSSDDYMPYPDPVYDEGLSFNLYTGMSTIPGYEFAEDCTITLHTPNSIKEGEIYGVYGDYASFDFFWDELTWLTSIVLETEVAGPVEGKPLYYPTIDNINGWNQNWEHLIFINSESAWYYNDTPTEDPEDYEEYEESKFKADIALDLWMNFTVAENVTIDPDCIFTLRTPDGIRIGSLYSFNNESKNVSCDFFWDEAVARAPVSNPFVDVKKKDYFYDAVLWAVDEGVTSGVDATHFGPNESCTRAQAVTFMWRAAGCPEPTSEINPFTDVKKKDYYYKAVLWAVENGITAGASATTFAPNAPCTRG